MNSLAARFLATLFLALALALGLEAVAAQSGPQPGSDPPAPPAGVLSVAIDGQAVGNGASPSIASCQPTVSGTANAALVQSISVSIDSGPSQTAPVGADGKWAVMTAPCLPQGSHTLFVNGSRVATFAVRGADAPSVTPAPPAAGKGWLETNGSSAWTLAAAVIALFVISGGVLLAARHRG